VLHFAGSKWLCLSFRIYDEALSAGAIAELAAIPEPALTSLLLTTLGLVGARRNRSGRLQKA
jgi:hypothetical protein